MSSGENLKESAGVAKRVEEKQNNDVIEFSTGVKLRIKEEISPSTLVDIVADLEESRPQPPTVYIESLDRDEINFDDPEYAKRLERWDTLGTKRILDALILLGTEILFVPKGMEKPEDNMWIGLQEVLGFKINRRNEAVRYLAWVKAVAMKNVNDLKVMTEQVGRRAGVSEADVQLAQKSFPGKDGDS
jgi:hypothetical protein